MDYLSRGIEAIRTTMRHYERLMNSQPKPGIWSSVIFDEERGHYMLVSRGWDGKRRIETTYLFVRVHDGKFWIEEDWSEEGIATRLLAAGVPNDKIVLAFQHPSMRPYTEFAVA